MLTSTLTPTLVVSCVLKALNQSVIILSGFNLIHTPTVFKLPKVVPTSHMSPYHFPLIKGRCRTMNQSGSHSLGLTLICCTLSTFEIHGCQMRKLPRFIYTFIIFFSFFQFFSGLHEISRQQKRMNWLIFFLYFFRRIGTTLREIHLAAFLQRLR